MVFDFSGNALTISAGTTKKVYIYGDTTDLGDAGDTIQLWLSDGTSTYVDWQRERRSAAAELENS
jgi:hypothetical protein